MFYRILEKNERCSKNDFCTNLSGKLAPVPREYIGMEISPLTVSIFRRVTLKDFLYYELLKVVYFFSAIGNKFL